MLIKIGNSDFWVDEIEWNGQGIICSETDRFQRC